MLCLMMFLHLVCVPSSALAFNASPIELENQSFWSGFVGGIVAHELGHVLVASAYGQRAQLNRGSIVYPDSTFSKQELLRVSTAGFQTQWLLSEWSFASLHTENVSSFLDEQHHIGIISSHLAVSFAYAAGLKEYSTSDVYAASQATGRSRNQLALLALIPALIDSYRLFGDNVPSWLSKASMSIKATEIGLIWSF